MIVQQILKSKGAVGVITVTPGTSVEAAAAVLSEKRIGSVVVSVDGKSCAGILSERDIVRRMAETPGQTLPQSVGDLMTRDVQTCDPNDRLIDVLKRMSEGRFRHMPVVASGHLCGIVTIGDVVQFRLKELEYEALRMKQMIVG